MPSTQRKPVSAYRRRLKRRGVVRVEVHVRKDDAALVRGVAQALSDPVRETEARALLRERFGVALEPEVQFLGEVDASALWDEPDEPPRGS